MENKKKYSLLPLLDSQKGIWLAQQLDPLNPRYNCGGFLEVHGLLSFQWLKQAVNQTLIEAEALRVQFLDDGQDIWQVVVNAPTESVERVDISRELDAQRFADDWMKADLLKPVDLTKAPLFRFVLFQISNDNFLIYFRYHHIVMDGFGQVIFWQRTAEIYSALAESQRAGETSFSSLKKLIQEEADYQGSSQFCRDKDYWLNVFSDSPEPARLSRRPPLASRGLLRRKLNISDSQIEQLQVASKEAGVRWSVLVVAAVAAYLYRMTNMQNIVIALPVTARLTPPSQFTPCMLANELPLRLWVDSNTSVTDLIQQVSKQIAYVLKHQRYPSEVLNRELNKSINDQKLTGPVVNVISFDNALKLADHVVVAHHLSTGPVTDLLIGFYGKSDAEDLQLYFDANPDIYTVEDVESHQSRFLNFLDGMTWIKQDALICDIDLLLAVEQQQIQAFNYTERRYDLAKCLHELITEQALQTPEAIAVSIEGDSLSYQQLTEQSDRLAAYLREQGVLPAQFIGVYELRSLEMVVSLLAILKAGAAYVPLDPELPISRIEFQVKDAGMVCVLSCSSLSSQLADVGVSVIETDRLLCQLMPVAVPLPTLATPESPAYVIYTSGSTGQPKGVVVPHRGIVNRLLWMQEEYPLDNQDCVLQKTPFTFDVSVWEFFWPLFTGARLFLAEPGLHRDPRYLAKTICEQRVTTTHFVPAMLDLFLAEDEVTKINSLRRVICSGETLRPETVKHFFDVFTEKTCATQLHNLYGPTEASIDVTAWQCHIEDSREPIPIGRAIANTRLHVLDANAKPVPIGVPGELYIAGVQVALGYVNRAELTTERFVSLKGIDDGVMYRTGDLVYYRQDGALEFLGRMDHQVKIRGFRIELGEIESLLLAHPSVEQAVVVAREYTHTDRRLVAYLMSHKASLIDQNELQTFLAEQLPEYMVPSHWLVLDELPYLLNGKIDRKALPAPLIATETTDLLPPVTAHETLLCQVCCEVLALEAVGNNQSLFALGIDSMMIIRLRAAVEKQGFTFNVQDLFQHPTIRELAVCLRTLTESNSDKTSQQAFSMLCEGDLNKLPAGIVDAYPLSAMQNSMLFQTEFDAESAVYRVVTSLHIAVSYEQQALHQAIADTYTRHPALRSAFDLSNYSEPLQLVYDAVDVDLTEQDDLSHLSVAEQQQFIQDWVAKAKYHQFDLLSAPLLFFIVHRLSEQAFQLSVVEHHVVLDGWSDVMMLEEIINRYKASLSGDELCLPEVTSSYRAFIAEERRVIADVATQDFWSALLSGVEPVPLPRKTQSPTKKAVTQHQAFHADLPGGLIEALRSLARAEALPLKSLLAAVHVSVLRLVCNSNKVLTGLVFNGRLEQEGGDEAIGVFLNTLPLQIDTAEHSLLSMAHAIFQYESKALPHGRYPFVQMQQDIGKKLQLDSYVNFMDFHRDWHTLEQEKSLIKETIGVAETNFPLAVNFLIDPLKNDMRLWLDCDLSILDSAFCQYLSRYYERALSALVQSPETSMTTLDLLTPEERQLLMDWNNTALDYDSVTTIHELITQQAHSSPQAIALVHRWDELNYQTLNIRANQLAYHLQTLGVKPNQLVGVSLSRGLDLVIAMLAVLKAGAAYVPLDPGFPQARLEFIIDDAKINVLITNLFGSQGLKAERTVLVDAEAEVIAAQPETSVDVSINGDNLAYVIYTSGSTGLPKGTLIKHKNVTNFFMGMNKKVACCAEDVVLAVTSVSFDISVLEILWPLTHGAKIVLASEGLINNLSRDHSLSDKASELSLFFSAIDIDNIGCQQLQSLVKEKVTPLGWYSHDFLLPADAQNNPIEQGSTFNKLWRREISGNNNHTAGSAEIYKIATNAQGNPDTVFTSSCTVEAFQQAGEAGVNLFTHLLGQNIQQLTEKIAVYRQARLDSGHQEQGHVSLMLYTLLHDDSEFAKQKARDAFRKHLRHAEDLLRILSDNMGLELTTPMTEDNPEFRLNLVVDNYFEHCGLLGSPEEAVELLHALNTADVDEVACLIDFGLSPNDILASLPSLNRLRELYKTEIAELEHSFVDLCKRHRVTLMQCTPSFMSAVVADEEVLQSLQTARTLLIGGETFPVGLAEQLISALPDVCLFNMYGPTETTIWSTVHKIDPQWDIQSNMIPIGQAIANTQLLVLDSQQSLLPIGIEGELWIGGAGVAAGYLGRESLTIERFQPVPGFVGVFYRTGDRVRWQSDGLLEFLGRFDRQIKIRGHRIEPDEIESRLSRHPQVAEVAVITQGNDSSSTTELLAYVVPAGQLLEQDAESQHVQYWQEVWQSAYTEGKDDATTTLAEYDFSGWLSSYTNESIPTVQMQEWLQHTVNKIMALSPHRIIDVGVGVGLILRELAPHVQHYLGIDISEAALQKAAQYLSLRNFDSKHIELICGDANYLGKLSVDTASVVVINSVIQYFPNQDYLQHVLSDAVRVAGNKGAVFVGDVRSLELLEVFHTCVQFHRAPPLSTVKEILTTVNKQVSAERELCLASTFFADFAHKLPGQIECQIELKRGHAENELNAFRYDVSLLGEQHIRAKLKPTKSIAWSTIKDLNDFLQQADADSTFVIKDIPNQRLMRPLQLMRLLNELDDNTSAWEVERQLWAFDDASAIHPEVFSETAEQLGWQIKLLISPQAGLDKFDAVFEPGSYHPDQSVRLRETTQAPQSTAMEYEA